MAQWPNASREQGLICFLSSASSKYINACLNVAQFPLRNYCTSCASTRVCSSACLEVECCNACLVISCSTSASWADLRAFTWSQTVSGYQFSETMLQFCNAWILPSLQLLVAIWEEQKTNHALYVQHLHRLSSPWTLSLQPASAAGLSAAHSPAAVAPATQQKQHHERHIL